MAAIDHLQDMIASLPGYKNTAISLHRSGNKYNINLLVVITIVNNKRRIVLNRSR